MSETFGHAWWPLPRGDLNGPTVRDQISGQPCRKRPVQYTHHHVQKKLLTRVSATTVASEVAVVEYPIVDLGKVPGDVLFEVRREGCIPWVASTPTALLLTGFLW